MTEQTFEHVSLYYAKAFDGDWYLLRALATSRCQLNLRTSGGALLIDHALPQAGLQDSWKFAMFIGKFYPEETGWQGTYEGVWAPWTAR